MIVVDTNVIGYLYLTSERSQQAEQALRRDPQWVAPPLWRSEMRNVLALHVRRKQLLLKDACRIMEEAVSLMRGREYQVASRQVLALAASSGCPAYGCEFVALAQDLGLPLITVGNQILRQFPACAFALAAFV
jgi:predicted nucleic acid-binding protein